VLPPYAAIAQMPAEYSSPTNGLDSNVYRLHGTVAQTLERAEASNLSMSEEMELIAQLEEAIARSRVRMAFLRAKGR
jgi:fructose-1,6-bisphosphatase